MSQHMARLISMYSNHDRPRRVHLVSRVSTVRSPFPIDRAGIFYCISFAAFIGPAISHPIPIRSRSVGHLRSVYISFSFSLSDSQGSLHLSFHSRLRPRQEGRHRVRVPLLIATLQSRSVAPLSPVLPSLRFALSLRSDRPRLLTSHV